MSSTAGPVAARRGRWRDGLLTTGQMARRSKNTLRTVRFYEQQGLIHPEERTDGGHRLFAPDQLTRLAVISQFRAAGLSLDEIRELLNDKRLAASGEEAARRFTCHAERHISRLGQQAQLLEHLVSTLQGARERVERCRHCHDRVRFPDGCGDCPIMQKDGELSDVLRVLWGLE